MKTSLGYNHKEKLAEVIQVKDMSSNKSLEPIGNKERCLRLSLSLGMKMIDDDSVPTLICDVGKEIPWRRKRVCSQS